jgi:hypothetical protein
MKVPREIVLSRYPLDRWQIGAGFDGIGDGGVAHNLPSHALGAQARNDDCLAEWLVHAIAMPSKACAEARGRKCLAGGVLGRVSLALTRGCQAGASRPRIRAGSLLPVCSTSASPVRSV